MTKKILFSKNANPILMDVVPKHEFNIHMGTSIKNLQELADALEIMDDTAFKHHVTKDKNDFSNWVGDAIGDIILSKDLMKAKTSEKAFKEVNKRIKQIEGPSGHSTKIQTNFFTNEFLIGLVLGLVLGFLISAIINRLI